MAQSPPGASYLSTYDGNYAGTMVISQDLAAGQRGAFRGRMAPCSAGPFQKTMTIINGQFLFKYNLEIDLKLSGSVDSHGSVSASATSSTGGIKLAAQITGNDLAGTVGSAYCIYALQLRK
jgi:hypothetical protein